MDSTIKLLNVLADLIDKEGFDSDTSAAIIRSAALTLVDAKRGLIGQTPEHFERAFVERVKAIRISRYHDKA